MHPTARRMPVAMVAAWPNGDFRHMLGARGFQVTSCLPRSRSDWARATCFTTQAAFGRTRSVAIARWGGRNRIADVWCIPDARYPGPTR